MRYFAAGMQPRHQAVALERFQPACAVDPGRFARGTALRLLAMARHVASTRLVPQANRLGLASHSQAESALDTQKQMEKSYSLRNVRAASGPDEDGVSATIYLGHRRIGAIHDDFDGGTVRFEFDLFTDRIVFEQYVEHWWTGARKDGEYDPVTAEFAHNDPAFVPSLQAKMRYWMKSMVSESRSAKRPRRAA
jgi:hypothetical protein